MYKYTTGTSPGHTGCQKNNKLNNCPDTYVPVVKTKGSCQSFIHSISKRNVHHFTFEKAIRDLGL